MANEGLEGVGAFFEDGPTLAQCKERFPRPSGVLRVQGFQLLHFFAARYPDSSPHLAPILSWLTGSPHWEDVNAPCGADGCPPLRHAVEAQNVAMLLALIKAGADVHQMSEVHYNFHGGTLAAKTSAVKQALAQYEVSEYEHEKQVCRQLVLHLLDAGARTAKDNEMPIYAHAFLDHKKRLRQSCIALLAAWRSGKCRLLSACLDHNMVRLVARIAWGLRFEL